MAQPAPTYATLDEWIAREAIPFSLDVPDSFNAAVGRVIAALGDTVDVLGLGEALHGGEEPLILRNRLFQRLVEAHGYRTGSTRNPSYFPLAARTLADFDWLVVLDSVTYSRGGPPRHQPDTHSEQ